MKKFHLLLIIVLSFSVTIFAQDKKLEEKFKPSSIPDSFSIKKTLLVYIPYRTNVWKRKTEKGLSEYLGTVEVRGGSREEMMAKLDEEFPDKTRYPYILIVWAENGSSGYLHANTAHIIDRRGKTEFGGSFYPIIGQSKSWSDLLEFIAIKLNEKVAKK
jgi:hypothetical protein